MPQPGFVLDQHQMALLALAFASIHEPKIHTVSLSRCHNTTYHGNPTNLYLTETSHLHGNARDAEAYSTSVFRAHHLEYLLITPRSALSIKGSMTKFLTEKK